jgi:hypothetical protein
VLDPSTRDISNFCKDEGVTLLVIGVRLMLLRSKEESLTDQVISELDCTDTSPDNFNLSLGFNFEMMLEIETVGISGS